MSLLLTFLHNACLGRPLCYCCVCPPRVLLLAAIAYERYKIIVQVTIGELRDQGVRVASRSLWDTNTDNYASASFQNQSLWCSCMVFGVYQD